MKLGVIIVILFLFSSCDYDKKIIVQSEVVLPVKIIDTIVVKQQNVFPDSSSVDIYSKSYSYYCIVGNDTMKFALRCNEHKSDSTLNLTFHQREGMLFTTFLRFVEKCIPEIQEDFNINRLNTIYFNSPIYYPDLSISLSKEYAHKFGSKIVGYKKLNEFLLNSYLTTTLNRFLKPLGKKTNRYSIEKFGLLDKKYLSYYLQNADVDNYPDFVLHGGGISVQLEHK